MAREVVRIEIERRVDARVDALTNSRIGALAQRALSKTDADVHEVRRKLKEEVPRQVASTVGNMLRADCECRLRLSALAQAVAMDRLASLSALRENLVSLIETTYARVAESLMREFRIFTGTNALAFGLLYLISYRRKAAALQLALPAVVLVAAVGTTGTLYLLNQNWLHTVVFGEYVGLAYAGYLALVATCFTDIAFNRARVTSSLLNAMFQVVGTAVKAIPC
jgi:hypothetical protein